MKKAFLLLFLLLNSNSFGVPLMAPNELLYNTRNEEIEANKQSKLLYINSLNNKQFSIFQLNKKKGNTLPTLKKISLIDVIGCCKFSFSKSIKLVQFNHFYSYFFLKTYDLYLLFSSWLLFFIV